MCVGDLILIDADPDLLIPSSVSSIKLSPTNNFLSEVITKFTKVRLRHFTSDRYFQQLTGDEGLSNKFGYMGSPCEATDQDVMVQGCSPHPPQTSWMR